MKKHLIQYSGFWIILIATVIILALLIKLFYMLDIISKITVLLLMIIIPATFFKAQFQKKIFPYLKRLGISENWLLDRMLHVNDPKCELGSGFRNPCTEEKYEVAKILRADSEEAVDEDYKSRFKKLDNTLLNDLDDDQFYTDIQIKETKPKKKRSTKKHKK